MSSISFLFCAAAAVLVMGGLHFFLRKEQSQEGSGSAPLESGFASTGKVCSFFSLQFFTILILFLVLDLEIVFVVAFLLSGALGKGLSTWFVFLIFVSLWAEWGWGKLSWALLVVGVWAHLVVV